MSSAEGSSAAPDPLRSLTPPARSGLWDVSREQLAPILAGTILPFALVFYLALEGGGYDEVVRSEVGVAIWWIVLLGALVGVLPLRRPGRAELICLALLLAFAAWTALGVSWSQSSGRSIEEVSRVLVLLGVFALSLAAQDGEALARSVRSVGFAIALVGAIALLSRLEPSWFPAPESLPEVRARLAYPLNYWNGLAALMALGLPLVAVVAAQSRRLVVQGVATGLLPLMGLAGYYTLSRGGAIEFAVALIVLFALYPRRLELLPTVALGFAGAALAIAAASQRGDLADNLQTATAGRQGDEMLAVILVVSTGVALLRVALGLAVENGLWPRITPSRRTSAILAGAVAVVVVVTGLAVGLPSRASQGWHDFKQQDGPDSDNSAKRFQSASGNGRWQYWSAAADANASRPWTGIGPGTFEFWWAEHGSVPGFIRNAHSLYMETLAELGIPGLALIATLLAGVFAAGLARLRRADGSQRALLAAALAAVAAFAVSAGIDWTWEVTVLPVAFVLLAASVLRATPTGAPGPGPAGDPAGGWRIGLVLLSIVSLAVIAVPLLAARDLSDSQSDVRAGRLDDALSAADSAQRLEPFAADPDLQRALVLETQGNLNGAAAAAREATREESRNWRIWLTLSRIQAERGSAPSALAAYNRARSLNPRSQLFATAGGQQQ